MKSSNRSLIVLFVALVVLAAGATFGIRLLMGDVCDETVKDAMQAVGTTGGIISGLSVNGTAVLALSGRYREAVLTRWGTAVRVVLFGGFFVVVSVSLGAAMSVVWVSEPWTRWLLAASVPLYLLVFVMTALLVSAAFKWESRPAKQSTNDRPNPLKGDLPEE